MMNSAAFHVGQAGFDAIRAFTLPSPGQAPHPNPPSGLCLVADGPAPNLTPTPAEDRGRATCAHGIPSVLRFPEAKEDVRHKSSFRVVFCDSSMEGVQRRPGLPGNPSSGRIAPPTGATTKVVHLATYSRGGAGHD